MFFSKKAAVNTTIYPDKVFIFTPQTQIPTIK